MFRSMRVCTAASSQARKIPNGCAVQIRHMLHLFRLRVRQLLARQEQRHADLVVQVQDLYGTKCSTKQDHKRSEGEIFTG